MIVDDRLDTVLRTAAAGTGAAAIRLRQLIDLLGRLPDAEWTGRHHAALETLDSLADQLAEPDRVRVIEGSTIRSAQLVRHLAGGSPRAAGAAIAAARLSAADWLALVPELPVGARGFLRHRRDLGPEVESLLQRFGIGDFALPLPEGYEAQVAGQQGPAASPPESATITPLPPLRTRAASPVEDATAANAGANGIGAIVRRIEAFRRARAPLADTASGADPRLPFADEPEPAARRITEIPFRCDADGRLVWADGPALGLLWGAMPFAADGAAPLRCDPLTARAVRERTPVREGRIEIEGGPAVAGAWQVDAIPLFADRGGRFTGYLGRMRRPAEEPVSADAAAIDRLRQLLHELRTPVNAIQGFAELIQQQIFGPTPHDYRGLAAGIASDAARILGGFEEIDRLVAAETGRVHREAGEPSEGADLDAMLARLITRLDPVIGPREVAIALDRAPAPAMVALDPTELERLLWRVLAVIGSAAGPGEKLAAALAARPACQIVTLTLPASLAAQGDEALFAPGGTRSGATSMLGNGFALRLAAAEARAAGGALTRDGAALVLKLPALTEGSGKHTRANENTGDGAAAST